MSKQHTHYDNLKVSRNAPPEVIRAAYKALSQRYHPDKNQSPDATRIMKILNEAYEVLGDAKRRQQYDATLVDETDEPTDSQEKYGKREDPPQPRASQGGPKHSEGGEPPRPSTMSGRPPRQATKARAGWLWIVGILVAILIRVATSSPNYAGHPQIVAQSPDLSSASSATPTAIADTSLEEQSKIITSFDCNKAHSTSEKLICSDGELASMDLDLASVFARAKAAAADKRKFAESARTAWNWRNANCFDKACLVTWYGQQRERLTALLEQSAQPLAASDSSITTAAFASAEQSNVATAVQAPDTTPSTFYAERVARRVRPNVIWAGEANGLATMISVRAGRAGNLLSATIVRSSGNPAWDAAALRAVELSDPMPLDVSGEAPTQFTITLSPNPANSLPPQSSREQALAWAHSLSQQHADATTAYDIAKEKLNELGASCPDVVLLQQSPQKAGPYKPVVMFLSQQCGYMVGYWPDSGEEQASFDQSTIENWAEWCSMRGGTQTSCVRRSGT